VLGVTRSKFYRWKNTKAARLARKEADAALAEVIEAAWRGSGQRYGAKRITPELREAGWLVNRKRVERLMAERGIQGRSWRPKRPVTTVPDPEAATVSDRLERDFTAERLGQKLVGDITYLPIADGSFLYLATVIDVCSRRIIGWSIADHMRTSLIVDALDGARRTRGSLQGSIFHSDNGAQYTSLAFARYCDRHGVLRSRGKVGTSADNALAEAFHASLKREVLGSDGKFSDARTARAEMFSYLNWFNLKRRHSSLGYRSPIDFERQLDTVPTNV
jgi:transposase InsO family protein